VVARIRSIGPFSTSTLPGENLQSMPLTGTAWTQLATGFDRLYLLIKLTDPTSCEGSGGPSTFGALEGDVLIDNVVTKTFTNALVGGAGPESTELSLSLFDPGVATVHTFAIKVGDTCQNGSGHYTIASVQGDVVEST
jgi:hypothetical protein